MAIFNIPPLPDPLQTGERTNQSWLRWFHDVAGKITAIYNAITPPGQGTVVALTDGATPALDASLGNIFTLSAAGDRTIAVPTNPTNGQQIIIAHTASGGARTLSLNSGAGGFAFGSTITGLTLTSSGKIDYIGCIYNKTANLWHVIMYTKGF